MLGRHPKNFRGNGCMYIAALPEYFPEFLAAREPRRYPQLYLRVVNGGKHEALFRDKSFPDAPAILAFYRNILKVRILARHPPRRRACLQELRVEPSVLTQKCRHLLDIRGEKFLELTVREDVLDDGV